MMEKEQEKHTKAKTLVIKAKRGIAKFVRVKSEMSDRHCLKDKFDVYLHILCCQLIPEKDQNSQTMHEFVSHCFLTFLPCL